MDGQAMTQPAGFARRERTSGFDDRRMEAIMGRLLQTGVLLASVVIFAGAVLYLAANHHHLAAYQVFVSEPAALRNPRQLLHGAAHADAASLIQLGVLLL